MTPGLLAAQAAHISNEWLRKQLSPFPEKQALRLNPEQRQWLDGPVLSILAVEIPEELDVLTTKAKELGVPFHVWRDTIPSRIFSAQGKSFFLEVVVGVAFGPADDEKIKQVTGVLPLY